MSKTAQEVIAEWFVGRSERCHDNADSILQALREEGYLVVPVEPTEKMKDAGAWAEANWRGLGLSQAMHVWNAMISAADGE